MVEGVIEEVCSVSKRGAPSTKTGVSPIKKVVVTYDPVSGSSIKKRLQYFKHASKGGGSKKGQNVKEVVKRIGNLLLP